MKHRSVCTLLSFFFVFECFALVRSDLIANEIQDSSLDLESQALYESSAEYFEALRSNSVLGFKLNNDSDPAQPTNVTLTLANRTLLCEIKNLVPNNGYLVNFYRNDVGFAFYRVRESNVIWSTMNLNTFSNFFPTKGNQSSYPNFTATLSPDSLLYGDYQCSVTPLGMLKNDNEIIFNSNHIVVVREKGLSPEIRWKRIFPGVNVTFNMSEPYYVDGSVYQAKCQVRFDRPVIEYIVYFQYDQKTLGAYIVRTNPENFIKWQLFPNNLFASNLTVLDLEEESSYPTFSILVKPTENPKKFSCKLEIPSKKHPIRFYSNEFLFTRKPVLRTVEPTYTPYVNRYG